MFDLREKTYLQTMTRDRVKKLRAYLENNDKQIKENVAKDKETYRLWENRKEKENELSALTAALVKIDGLEAK